MIRRDARAALILAAMCVVALLMVLGLMALPLSPAFVLWLTTRSAG